MAIYIYGVNRDNIYSYNGVPHSIVLFVGKLLTGCRKDQFPQGHVNVTGHYGVPRNKGACDFCIEIGAMFQ